VDPTVFGDYGMKECANQGLQCDTNDEGEKEGVCTDA
jgi:hypothetical protein